MCRGGGLILVRKCCSTSASCPYTRAREQAALPNFHTAANPIKRKFKSEVQGDGLWKKSREQLELNQGRFLAFASSLTLMQPEADAAGACVPESQGASVREVPAFDAEAPGRDLRPSWIRYKAWGMWTSVTRLCVRLTGLERVFW